MPRLPRLALDVALGAGRPLRVARRAAGRLRRRARGLVGRGGLEVRPRPLGVLFEATSLDRGGLEGCVRELASRLDPSRFRPVVACVERGGMTADALSASGIPVHVVGGWRDAFAALLARERIDLLNAHYSLFGSPLAASRGIPQVHVVHNSYLWLDEGGVRRMAWGLAAADRVVAVSSEVARYAARRLRVSDRRLEVVANGVEAEAPEGDEEGARAELRRELGLDPGATVVLHVGAYEPRKGQLALLHALGRCAERLPRAAVVCVGPTADAGYRAECERFARAAGLAGRVRLVGHRTDLSRAYGAADAFALPSLVEGFSLAALEAVAAGLPVLLTDTGGAQDLFAAGAVGRLLPAALADVAEATPDEVARASRGPQEHVVAALEAALVEAGGGPGWRERARLASAGLRARHDWRTVARRYEAVFEKAVAEA